jgi:alkylated DNA repair dioxygenase AlkB
MASMATYVTQGELFGFAQQFPHGFVYKPDFVAADEEAALLAAIETLPLEQAQYKEYTAKRRVVGFGSRYDYIKNDLVAAPPFPPFLFALRLRIAQWLDIPESRFVHALITEYRPGTPIGWHRDAPHFETVVGVSLAGWCRMRLRPRQAKSGSKDIIVLDLAPRSVYVMQRAVRWDWHHSIAPTRELRYSVTLRTLSPP